MYDANPLIQHLRAASVGREDAVFATQPKTAGGDVTFGALFARAEQMAAALVSRGVEPGDRVAVQVHKSLAAIELYLGTVMAGAIFLPLNTAYTDAEVAYFIADGGTEGR
jgi:malonyl-CoA/methylmalonyl-CoA synthetase